MIAEPVSVRAVIWRKQALPKREDKDHVGYMTTSAKPLALGGRDRLHCKVFAPQRRVAER